MRPGSLRFPKAVLFDMDGTLTKPMLDFPAIKAEMGIGARPILEALAEMDVEARARAESVLNRHETKAALESELNPGCNVLLDWLRTAAIPTALITRNCSQSVQTVLERHGMDFSAVIAREDGPFKPDPWPVLQACQRLGASPRASWMVGDGRYDIEAGNAAGTSTVWISHDRKRPFDTEPTAIAAGLHELLQLLEEFRQPPA